MAVPSSVFYTPELATEQPRVDGILTGTVQTSSTTPGLDSNGNYKVKLHLDEVTMGTTNASTLDIRRMQPFHGPATTGLNMPLYDTTEVAVAFVQGDPDRPTIIGTLADQANPAVITSSNSQVNRIKTNSGALFEISDA